MSINKTFRLLLYFIHLFKLKLLVLFSYEISLKNWYDLGILSRELAFYKQIKEKKNHVTFLTYGEKNDYQYRQNFKDLNVIPVSYLVKSKFKLVRYLKSLLLPIKLKSLFKNVDIIKSNQISGSWIAWLAKLLYRKKFIVRGGYEYLRNFIASKKLTGSASSLVYYLSYIFIYVLEFISYRLADVIFLASNSDIQFVKRSFKLKRKKKQIHLIYNFVDINLFKPKLIEKRENHLLFIGRLIPTKNLVNLLLALRKLDGYTLDIIGEGPMMETLREKAKQYKIHINFLGVIPNKQLPNIINRYSLFILPSYYEGNPKVLLEAMSCGIACIGTNVRGIKDIIHHEKNGYLCEPNPTSIAQAIITVNENKDLVRKLGNEARNFIIKQCSLNRIVDREISIYKDLMKA